MAKRKKKEVYFNDPRTNELYLRVKEDRKTSKTFKGMTTMEILDEIRKN